MQFIIHLANVLIFLKSLDRDFSESQWRRKATRKYQVYRFSWARYCFILWSLRVKMKKNSILKNWQQKDQKTCTFWKWNKNLIMKTISKGKNGRDTHCLNFSETMLCFLFRVSDISSQSLLKKTHSPLLDENPLDPFTHWTFHFPSYWIQAQQVSITAWSHFPRSIVYSLVGSGCLIHSSRGGLSTSRPVCPVMSESATCDSQGHMSPWNLWYFSSPWVQESLPSLTIWLVLRASPNFFEECALSPHCIVRLLRSRIVC